MPKCVVYTHAYNAEKTLERTVRSVLNQTYQEFEYYLVDNASTDRTGELIREFARADPRIKASANRVNMEWNGNSWFDIAGGMDPDDLFCQIDADDEYKPDFLSRGSAFLRENRLDIVACGSDFLDERTGRKVGERAVPEGFIVEGRGFSDYFPWYHQFMRTIWGKLFRAEILQKYDPERAPRMNYGGDTLFGIESFRQARRVGVLAEQLHLYYWAPKTLSYQLDPNRVFATKELYQAPRRFLMEKCGVLTPENDFFILRIYFGDLEDSMNVILGSEAPDAEKLGMFLELMEFKPSEQLMTLKRTAEDRAVLCERRDKLFDRMLAWMTLLEDIPDETVERFCRVGQLLCATLDRPDEWLFFERVREQFQAGAAE